MSFLFVAIWILGVFQLTLVMDQEEWATTYSVTVAFLWWPVWSLLIRR